MDNDLKQNSNIASDEVDLIEIIKTIWAGRKLIVGITTIFVVIGVLYALLATPVYQASITLYPANQNEDGGIGKLSGLASTFGIGSTGSNIGYYIPDVIRSRKILNKVIFKKWQSEREDVKAIDLLQFWEYEGENRNRDLELALKKIRKKIDIVVDDDSGLITVFVNMRDGKIAADIANFIGREVNYYIQNEQVNSARQSRIFVEKRLITVKDELSITEEALNEFLTVNRAISESPDLQMEYGRLLDNLEIKKQICLTLEQQKELAMIEEVKKMPVLNVIDDAVKPELKLKPKRALVVILSFIMGFFFSIFLIVMIVFVRNVYLKYSIPFPPFFTKYFGMY